MNRSLIALALVALTGCGGWSVTSAQRALQIGAEAVEGSDQALAPIVAAAINRCDQEHETREAFLECVDPYRPIGYGVSLGRHALTVGQTTVDAWRTGENQGEAAWLAIAACILSRRFQSPPSSDPSCARATAPTTPAARTTTSVAIPANLTSFLICTSF